MIFEPFNKVLELNLVFFYMLQPEMLAYIQTKRHLHNGIKISTEMRSATTIVYSGD